MRTLRTLVAIIAAFALSACVAGEAAAPRISVQSPPRVLRVGQEWRASLRVRGERPRAFVIRKGARVSRFRLARSGRAHRASVVFPAAGRWRYGVRIGRSDRLVGTVNVRPRVPVLQQPHGVVEEPGGTLLVADFRENAVFRLEPGRGEGATLARVPGPRDLRPFAGGKLLVSSGVSVLELDPITGRTRPLARGAAELEGVAPAPNGFDVVEEQTRIVRLGADGSREVLADGLNGVHGILRTAEGLVICESFAGNVRLLAPDGSLRMLATGLGNPSAAVEAPAGLYVTEFSADRVSLITRSEAVRSIATVSSPGPIAVDRAGKLLVGQIGGRVSRIDPATGRVTQIWPR